MALVLKPHTFSRSNVNEALNVLEKGIKKYLDGGIWKPKSDEVLVGSTWDCHLPDRAHMVQGVWNLVQRALHRGAKRAMPRVDVVNGGSTLRFVVFFEEAGVQ